MRTIRDFFLKPWLYVLVITIGVALKFYHLDSKLFWMDEVSTVLYTSGSNNVIIQKNIPVNQIRGFGYYDSLLHVSTQPKSFKSEVAGILSGIHLTPAHYIILTVWYRLVGDDDMHYRLFSVCIFMLSLPLVFLLAKALYNSVLAGWISASLYAVSPFVQFESQEARYYILWVFFFLLTNYLLLKALKNNRAIWWICYWIAAVFALYTSITSGAFIFGHMLYIVVYKKESLFKFGIALLFIGLAYSPWMYFLFTHREGIQSGLAWHKYLTTSLFPFDLLFFSC